MGTKVPPIQRPNYIAIAGIDDSDLLVVREYYITRLVRAKRDNDSDTIEAALEWLVALTGEMRIRGGATPPKSLVVP